MDSGRSHPRRFPSGLDSVTALWVGVLCLSNESSPTQNENQEPHRAPFLRYSLALKLQYLPLVAFLTSRSLGEVGSEVGSSISKMLKAFI